MSYDITFKKNQGQRLTREDLNKLEDKFALDIFEENQEGIVGFAVKYKDNQPDWIKNDPGFEFYLQQDGSYYLAISYSATNEMFDYFQKLVKDLSEYLHIEVKDPQLEGSGEHPDSKYTPEKIFNVTQKIMNGLVPNAMDELNAIEKPTEKKFFIRYYFVSMDPITNKKMVLLYNQYGLDAPYDSRVLPGESIKQVIDRELPELVGEKEWLLNALQPTDQDFDKHGNLLDKYIVVIEIPYFNPAERQMRFPWRWHEFNA